MGDRDEALSNEQNWSRMNRRMTRVYGVMLCLLILVAVQFVLFIVGIEIFMSAGSAHILWWATAASAACSTGAIAVARLLRRAE